MGATHFLTRTLGRVSTEMSLQVFAYNLKRVMNILGVARTMKAMRMAGAETLRGFCRQRWWSGKLLNGRPSNPTVPCCCAAVSAQAGRLDITGDGDLPMTGELRICYVAMHFALSISTDSMFNFFVTADNGAWDRLGYEFDRSRFLEYTSDGDIAVSFRELKSPQIQALTELPTGRCKRQERSDFYF